MKRSCLIFSLVVAAIGFLAAAPGAFSQPKNDAAPINIGLVKAFFNDVDPTLIEIAVEPFGKLMKQATGMEGKLAIKDDAFQIAKKLDNGQLHIGVFHGHEFAWVQKKFPKITPLMVAVNQYRDVKAFVVVNKNSPAKDLKDLRGKVLDMPEGTKEHCHVYLNGQCCDNGTPNVKTFFKSIAKSKSPIASLDNLARGGLDAVLVDTITLEFYKEIKGPAFKNFLRVLAESKSFPAPVIAYKDGSLTPATLKSFREGLTNAHKNPDGEDILRMWQIDRFLPLPDNYSKSLADTLELYPAPTAIKISTME